MTNPNTPERSRPWMMRAYSGHSTAAASNELARTNLAKGQTGLSIAFDLPTQNGYDPDHPLARGEVGKVGVPVVHKGHMATLLDGIPVGRMNTSMTINAPASWMLALYVVNARACGVASEELRGTTQNDIVKEYLSRGTYIFPPEASRRLVVDMFAYCSRHLPHWNPMNVCSYHLQEAGATPVQEIAFSLANAIDVLDSIRASGQVDDNRFPAVVASMSFFVNAGIRFVEETCKVRAFTRMWDRICRERYGVTDPKARRFRYGVQVNSLGLTEAQPENNIQRIVLEALGVTLSKDARARSLQLPAWNEALGLPRPWDQQWSLRIQQVLAHETDLLEYDDIFNGSHVIEAKTTELIEAAQAELDEVTELGGAFAAIEELKARLVRSNAERVRRIERGDQVVVGVNDFTESAPSGLYDPEAEGGEGSILRVDPEVGTQMVADLEQWRAQRDNTAVERALADLNGVAAAGDLSWPNNIMAATLQLAEAGGTTGEWAACLRGVFGEYRGPTGVQGARGAGLESVALRDLWQRVRALPDGPPRLLLAKPGLDGHSNGAEQIAVAARDGGLEVIYKGIRRTPRQIAAVAEAEDVDIIGLSILSGSHMELVPETIAELRAVGVDAPVVVGGIIPVEDQPALMASGVARIFTPKDYQLGQIVAAMIDLAVDHRRSRAMPI
ncbi:MAG: protein meaA [Acidimicrobiia bacterium]|nr:protein meaA [Acidimicrobiia bacterium]